MAYHHKQAGAIIIAGIGITLLFTHFLIGNTQRFFGGSAGEKIVNVLEVNLELSGRYGTPQ